MEPSNNERSEVSSSMNAEGGEGPKDEQLTWEQIEEDMLGGLIGSYTKESMDLRKHLYKCKKKEHMPLFMMITDFKAALSSSNVGAYLSPYGGLYCECEQNDKSGGILYNHINNVCVIQNSRKIQDRDVDPETQTHLYSSIVGNRFDEFLKVRRGKFEDSVTLITKGLSGSGKTYNVQELLKNFFIVQNPKFLIDSMRVFKSIDTVDISTKNENKLKEKLELYSYFSSHPIPLTETKRYRELLAYQHLPKDTQITIAKNAGEDGGTSETFCFHNALHKDIYCLQNDLIDLSLLNDKGKRIELDSTNITFEMDSEAYNAYIKLLSAERALHEIAENIEDLKKTHFQPYVPPEHPFHNNDSLGFQTSRDSERAHHYNQKNAPVSNGTNDMETKVFRKRDFYEGSGQEEYTNLHQKQYYYFKVFLMLQQYAFINDSQSFQYEQNSVTIQDMWKLDQLKEEDEVKKGYFGDNEFDAGLVIQQLFCTPSSSSNDSTMASWSKKEFLQRIGLDRQTLGAKENKNNVYGTSFWSMFELENSGENQDMVQNAANDFKEEIKTWYQHFVGNVKTFTKTGKWKGGSYKQNINTDLNVPANIIQYADAEDPLYGYADFYQANYHIKEGAIAGEGEYYKIQGDTSKMNKDAKRPDYHKFSAELMEHYKVDETFGYQYDTEGTMLYHHSADSDTVKKRVPAKIRMVINRNFPKGINMSMLGKIKTYFYDQNEFAFKHYNSPPNVDEVDNILPGFTQLKKYIPPQFGRDKISLNKKLHKFLSTRLTEEEEEEKKMIKLKFKQKSRVEVDPIAYIMKHINRYSYSIDKSEEKKTFNLVINIPIGTKRHTMKVNIPIDLSAYKSKFLYQYMNFHETTNELSKQIKKAMSDTTKQAIINDALQIYTRNWNKQKMENNARHLIKETDTIEIPLADKGNNKEKLDVLFNNWKDYGPRVAPTKNNFESSRQHHLIQIDFVDDNSIKKRLNVLDLCGMEEEAAVLLPSAEDYFNVLQKTHRSEGPWKLWKTRTDKTTVNEYVKANPQKKKEEDVKYTMVTRTNYRNRVLENMCILQGLPALQSVTNPDAITNIISPYHNKVAQPPKLIDGNYSVEARTIWNYIKLFVPQISTMVEEKTFKTFLHENPTYSYSTNLAWFWFTFSNFGLQKAVKQELKCLLCVKFTDLITARFKTEMEDVYLLTHKQPDKNENAERKQYTFITDEVNNNTSNESSEPFYKVDRQTMMEYLYFNGYGVTTKSNYQEQNFDMAGYLASTTEVYTEDESLRFGDCRGDEDDCEILMYGHSPDFWPRVLRGNKDKRIVNLENFSNPLKEDNNLLPPKLYIKVKFEPGNNS